MGWWRGYKQGQLSLPGNELNCGFELQTGFGSQIWAVCGFVPFQVATIPARSSLEETSLGELLPGSILSDSLKPKIFTRSEGPGSIMGQGRE